MSWVTSSPALSIPLPPEEPVVALTHVAHTPLLVIVTDSAVCVYHQHSLLPLTSHKRTAESLEAHGKNLSVEVKQLSLSTALLNKLPNANLFIRTDRDYLVIYLATIDYNLSMFEVTSKTSDEILQTSLPLSHTVSKFSLLYLIKSATRTIMRGTLDNALNLENIEHFANAPIEDEVSNDAVPLVKLSIFKVLKVNIGILRFWVKSNSHNLIVYSEPEEFQVVNVSTFKNELFRLSSYEWFENDIAYINYDTLNNYVLFVNSKYELWYLNFHLNEDSVLDLVAYKVFQFAGNNPEKKEELTFSISFNPQVNLVLVRVDEALKLLKYDYVNTKYELGLVKDISTINKNSCIEWSPLGSFFSVLNEKTGKWTLFSKFGNTLFDSATIFHEITAEITDNSTIDFLELSNVVIGPNSNTIYAVNKLQTKLYTVNLFKLGDYNTNADLKTLFYNDGYLSISNNSIGSGGSTSFSRFPILPKFKSIISKIEHVNGSTSNKNIKSVNGYLKMAVNTFNQFSMSYGNHLAISTPFQSGSSPIHVLWFNFLNYYTETLNIIDHFWFDDYLVLINRFIKDDEIFVDELIVLNTTQSRFGNGGGNSLGAEDGESYFKFDSDLILWRHNFDSQFIRYEVINDPNGNVNVKNLVVVSDDLKIIIIELAKDKPKEDAKNGKRYKIFIGINKTIHLSSIKHKLNIHMIQQMAMINGRHFFFLLSNGDFYVLKNQLSSNESKTLSPINIMKNNSSNMYDLIKINESIEFFQLKPVHFTGTEVSFIYLFNGSSLLVYDLDDLVDSAFDNSSQALQNDGLEEEQHDVLESSKKNVIDPIKIPIHGFQPLGIENVPVEYKESSDSSKKTSSLFQLLDLIGLEVNTIYKNMLLLKERLNRQVVLNDFIEYDLFVKKLSFSLIVDKYKGFDNFYYCLELLLFKCLTKEESDGEEETDDELDTVSLEKIISLIESIEDSESIYINCLRKIEIGYWHKFFDTLELTPVQFMNRLIKLQNVELCYNYLIIYLNFKKEFDDVFTPPPQSLPQNGNSGSLLDPNDRRIILEIINMLDRSQKWDRCFELCRFIKLLEPSNDLLRVIRESIKV